MNPLFYFDNAATTWPKPVSVIRAVQNALCEPFGNPGRGEHRLAAAAADIVYTCRCAAASLFNTDSEHVILTSNATHALNFAIKGLAVPGCHILLDNFSHNAVYRPALSLRKYGCTVEVYDASGSDDETIAGLRQKIRPSTAMILATHHSNICSKILPIWGIGELCQEYNIPLIVDAAQSAGHLPIDIERMHISALCVPGHKGLYGPMGIGMLLLKPGISLQPLLEGGAGISSLDEEMPETFPERLEPGTIPFPAAAGLAAGLTWIEKTGMQNIRKNEQILADFFTENTVKMPGIHLVGNTESSVISFVADRYTPAVMGNILHQHGICVRTGFHCAPLAHRSLGTGKDGTVRISFSHFNHLHEVETLLSVLRKEILS